MIFNDFFCVVQKVEKAEKLKEKLDSENFEYSPELLRQLAFLEAKYNDNVDGARHYLSEL